MVECHCKGYCNGSSGGLGLQGFRVFYVDVCASNLLGTASGKEPGLTCPSFKDGFW